MRNNAPPAPQRLWLAPAQPSPARVSLCAYACTACLCETEPISRGGGVVVLGGGGVVVKDGGGVVVEDGSGGLLLKMDGGVVVEDWESGGTKP